MAAECARPPVHATVGALLRDARDAAGLSQEQVAFACGVRRQTVSRWELGWHLPPQRLQRELERTLALPAGAVAVAALGLADLVTEPVDRARLAVAARELVELAWGLAELADRVAGIAADA